MTINNYSIQEYPFNKIISQLIGYEDLCNLSAGEIEMDPTNSIYKNTETTKHHQRLYQKLQSTEGDEFYKLYNHFIKEIVRPQYDEAIYFQKKPSHRIHYPEVPGQTRIHRDSDYGHNPAEINYWVPLTDAYGDNSIRLEQENGELVPIKIDLGQYLIFDGANKYHGAVKNSTPDCRVSFDFRIIPAKDYEKELEQIRATTENKDNSNPVMANARIFERCD
jgi:hypothetical protein